MGSLDGVEGPGSEFFFSKLVSDSRFAPYLQEANNDVQKARELYLWAGEVASAGLELLAHFEVGLRNVIDKALREHFEHDAGSVPWIFSRNPLIGEGVRERVEDTREGLSPHHRDSREQITANLHFGFWTRMLGKGNDELWRLCLQRAFPYARSRSEVGAAVEGIRNFRNRVAHHDSILDTDVPFECDRIFAVANYVDPAFEHFLKAVDRVESLYNRRPTEPADTLLVPGKKEWELYKKTSVYVCKSGRTFRPVRHLAFYVDRKIQTEIPAVKYRQDNITWNLNEARLLRKEAKDRNRPELRKIAQAIEELSQNGWCDGSGVEGRYQAFVLTSKDETQPLGAHRTLPSGIENTASGKGSGWVTKQRYLYLERLMQQGAAYLA